MDYDVIVIGSGPAGYTAACLCAKNELKTAVIEKDKTGGVCLNVGCIPTKALINFAGNYQMIKKNTDIFNNSENLSVNMEVLSEKVFSISENVSKGIDFLFKSNKVDTIRGTAKIIDKKTISVNDINYNAKIIILATGSRNKDISNFIEIENNPGNKLITSTEALFLKQKPGSIAILGGGAIGVEFGYIFNQLGSDVTILEYFPNLIPGMDLDCSKTLERVFKKTGIKVLTSSKVTKISKNQGEFTISYNRKEKEDSITAEYVLNALGRTPNTDIEGIENLNIEMEKGFIKVNENMQTSIDNIYAIGDIIYDSPLLAHAAYDEARVCAGHITGLNSNFKVDYYHIPYCIYTEPQNAAFGITESQAKEKNIDFKTVKIFFKSSGKAQAIDKTDGFIKFIIDKNDYLLGAHLTGPYATEIIHELLLASKNKISLDKIKDMLHAHPTISESIQDAAKSYYSEGLH